MTRTLLLRGMLAGLIAGLLMGAFARWGGGPSVGRASAFEAAMDQLKGEAPEPEIVSRKVQKSFGLLTAGVVYGTALGGSFGLVFAFARGRISQSEPGVLSALLAGIGFVSIVLVPALKYPANPPSVGNPETIGIRTAAYFLLILVSVVVVVIALQVRKLGSNSLGGWNAAVLSTVLYLCLIAVCAHFMPAIDEVPQGFPASLLWDFRVAALETQAVLWGSLAIAFGWLTRRAENTATQQGAREPRYS